MYRIIMSFILLLLGIVFVAGGVWLAVLGGSPFYVSSGIVLVIVAVLIARQDRRAGLLYAVLLAATLLSASLRLAAVTG